MAVSGVYEIVHLESERRYIGSSMDMPSRWRQHQLSLERDKHHSIYLQRVWNKYGPEAFVFRPILMCGKKDLIYYEQRAIDVLCPALNCAKKAGSQLGYRHRPDTIEKMKAAAVGRPSSFKGFKHTEEGRRKISESRKGKGGGRPLSEERRRKIGEAQKGKVIPPEQRAKISAKLTGLKQSQSTIAKRVAKLRGRKRPGAARIADSVRLIAQLRAGSSPTGRLVFRPEQVWDIRNRLSVGDKQSLIAKAYGVDPSVVSDIKCGRTYQWIGDRS